jgi:hypothetical protein
MANRRRTPTTHRKVAHDRPRPAGAPPANGKPPGGTVIHLGPEHALQRAAKRFLQEVPSRCTKCGSAFLVYEPAFVHCCYCGKMARLAGGSLLAQELFELRSGLRLAV